MAETTALEHFRYRIRRDTQGLVAWFRGNWQQKRWFRWVASVGAAGLVFLVAFWAFLASGLPDAETLVDYEPPLPTMVRGLDGEIVHSYARERRVQLQYADFPQEMIESFLAAEDKTFFTHGGVDITGTLGAVVDYATKMGSGERAVGGSTITQQVVKNELLATLPRDGRYKLLQMRYAILLERQLSKDQILERWFNTNFYGYNAYGIKAAAEVYFGKNISDLGFLSRVVATVVGPRNRRFAEYHNHEALGADLLSVSSDPRTVELVRGAAIDEISMQLREADEI